MVEESQPHKDLNTQNNFASSSIYFSRSEIPKADSKSQIVIIISKLKNSKSYQNRFTKNHSKPFLQKDKLDFIVHSLKRSEYYPEAKSVGSFWKFNMIASLLSPIYGFWVCNEITSKMYYKLFFPFLFGLTLFVINSIFYKIEKKLRGRKREKDFWDILKKLIKENPYYTNFSICIGKNGVWLKIYKKANNPHTEERKISFVELFDLKMKIDETDDRFLDNCREYNLEGDTKRISIVKNKLGKEDLEIHEGKSPDKIDKRTTNIFYKENELIKN